MASISELHIRHPCFLAVETRLAPYILDTAVRNGLDSKDSDEAKGIPLASR